MEAKYLGSPSGPLQGLRLSLRELAMAALLLTSACALPGIAAGSERSLPILEVPPPAAPAKPVPPDVDVDPRNEAAKVRVVTPMTPTAWEAPDADQSLPYGLDFTFRFIVNGRTYDWYPFVPFPADFNDDGVSDGLLMIYSFPSFGQNTDPQVCFLSVTLASEDMEASAIGVEYREFSVVYATSEIPGAFRLCGGLDLEGGGGSLSAEALLGNQQPLTIQGSNGNQRIAARFSATPTFELSVSQPDDGNLSVDWSAGLVEYDIDLVYEGKWFLFAQLRDFPTEATLSFEQSEDGSERTKVTYEANDSTPQVYGYYFSPPRGAFVAFFARDTPMSMTTELSQGLQGSARSLRLVHDAEDGASLLLLNAFIRGSLSTGYVEGVPAEFTADLTASGDGKVPGSMTINYTASGPMGRIYAEGRHAGVDFLVDLTEVPDSLQANLSLKGSRPGAALMHGMVSAQAPGMDLFLELSGAPIGGYVQIYADELPPTVVFQELMARVNEYGGLRIDTQGSGTIDRLYIEAELPDFFPGAIDRFKSDFYQLGKLSIRQTQFGHSCSFCQYYDEREVGNFFLDHGELQFGIAFSTRWKFEQCSIGLGCLIDPPPALSWVEKYRIVDANVIFHSAASLDPNHYTRSSWNLV